MSPEPRAPKPGVVKALKTAAAADDGRAPDGLSRRLVASMLEAGYVYRDGIGGVRIDNKDALDYDGPGGWRITDVGRRAVLTDAQWRALTERVAREGVLLPNVNWVTKQALHDLGLVEYRDDSGRIQPTDGSTGLRGPIYKAFRTETGRRVAAAELPAQ
ncbi:hypothetical protein [Streptomyces sp. NBC_01601]|uniref:hypothetical protein n=1 Tax=Streptomyces sp. NBC_01601 TaxID=2975892 RepID=UPI002E27D8B6|nr:hypothetical protein [Streptomyces sp. NBC_01601]